jgi:ABC-type multidrug transport system fused ATPase/permease subunit
LVPAVTAVLTGAVTGGLAAVALAVVVAAFAVVAAAFAALAAAAFAAVVAAAFAALVAAAFAAVVAAAFAAVVAAAFAAVVAAACAAAWNASACGATFDRSSARWWDDAVAQLERAPTRISAVPARAVRRIERFKGVTACIIVVCKPRSPDQLHRTSTSHKVRFRSLRDKCPNRPPGLTEPRW